MNNRDYIAAYLARRPHLGAIPSRSNATRDNSSIPTTTTAEATKAEATPPPTNLAEGPSAGGFYRRASLHANHHTAH